VRDAGRADRHEPPCNPYVGSAQWSTAHRNSYAQDSSPFPGPAPGDRVVVQQHLFANEVP